MGIRVYVYMYDRGYVVFCMFRAVAVDFSVRSSVVYCCYAPYLLAH